MRGALSHSPGYAVVPQLELAVVRLAIALRGTPSSRSSVPDDSFRRATRRR